jgi:hypothetical protein
MSILTVAQDASPKLGITRPTQLIADTGQTSVELQATIAEVAGIIRDKYDWQSYKALGTITGDGAAVSFAFPTNYARMLKVARMWPSTQPNSPLTHYQDSDAWLGMQVQNFAPVVGAWTIYGDRIYINISGVNAPLALAATVKFFHITNLQFKDAGGTPKAAVTADDDQFRLTPETSVGERLLKLGLIYKWKQDKGRPYAQDLSDFEDAISVAIGNDKGSKMIVVGNRRLPRGIEIALPWGVTDNGGP